MDRLRLSVLIPTFRRHESLNNCLLALSKQQRVADQVIVVVRPNDTPSLEVISLWTLSLRIDLVTITIPGQVQAMNVGLGSVRGDIVCFTDDDTMPHSDWLARIESHFKSDTRLGGLGGRDIVTEDGVMVPPQDVPVGIVAAYGKIFGNHHLGMGGPRRVNFLKGANMSFRMSALAGGAFDTDLRGKGAQVHQEIGFCLRVQNAGWKLLYDPAVAVEHYPATRHDSDQRGKPALDAIENAAFNLYLSLMRNLLPSRRRSSALFWARSVGTPSAPGIARGWLARVCGDEAGIARREAAKKAWLEAEHTLKCLR